MPPIWSSEAWAWVFACNFLSAKMMQTRSISSYQAPTSKKHNIKPTPFVKEWEGCSCGVQWTVWCQSNSCFWFNGKETFCRILMLILRHRYQTLTLAVSQHWTWYVLFVPFPHQITMFCFDNVANERFSNIHEFAEMYLCFFGVCVLHCDLHLFTL